MNTIPLTFDGWEIPHSVIGGAQGKANEGASELSVILLNRGGRYYRADVFTELEAAGFTSVLSVENSPEPYDVESLSSLFPSVKFLLPQNKLTTGEMINAAVAELASRFVFVLWSDQRIRAITAEKAIWLANSAKDCLFCLTPLLSDDSFGQLPVRMVSRLAKKQFSIAPLPCTRDMEKTIYPFDFTGLYNREKFIDYGGFDSSIANAYWQNADLGFRVNLWGGEIRISHHLRLNYESASPAESIESDSGYLKFYLKNLAPVFKERYAVLPFSKFFSFAAISGMSAFDAWHYFKDAAKWVSVNASRFVMDAPALVSSWEIPPNDSFNTSGKA